MLELDEEVAIGRGSFATLKRCARACSRHSLLQSQSKAVSMAAVFAGSAQSLTKTHMVQYQFLLLFGLYQP